METILRSREMAEIKLLPVRHHSPACAFHVQKIIEEWQPDVLLIEGPDNANDWIPFMVHEDTKPPFALYYAYDDAAGRISEEKEKYKCYYPFLEYSPELAAMRMGAKYGIYTAFIDMPYGDILAASVQGKGLLQKSEKSNYNDDYLLSRSTYMHMLCEKTGMRSFEEFWEKYFEVEGLSQESEQWFDHLRMHCQLSRKSTSQEELWEEGCIQREAYMAEQIEGVLCQKAGEHVRIVVVTGGFHTPALEELLQGENRQDRGKSLSRRRVPAENQSVYLMPYSMEAADALNGYASGMPFPGFYQTVWEKITEPECYNTAVLDYIVKNGKAVRSKEGGISTFDEICACSMARGLAALRGKPQAGAYELRDAVLSSFVKGEYNVATDLPMRELDRLMRGSRVGVLCQNTKEPPILQDFRLQCKKFGLHITATAGEEIVLSVFAKKKHRKMSMLFHRLDYLETGFAKRRRGPNLQSGRDRNLMRESWKYKWNTQTLAALTDVSVYGATIEEAAESMLQQKLQRVFTAREGALLLTKAFEMGFTDRLQSISEKLQELVLKDSDFYSLTETLRMVNMLKELSGLYQSEMELEELLAGCCRRVMYLLPAMTRVKEEEQQSCMGALKTLYQVTGCRSMQKDMALRETYLDILEQMKQDVEIQAGVNGCIHGILYGCGRETPKEIAQFGRGYLSGTQEQVMKTALFFRGLFFTAKDLVFIGEEFLKLLDEFLRQVPQEQFLKLLPELRMAFTYFTPGEIDRIARTAAAFHERKPEDILDREGIPENFLVYGRRLDAYVTQQIRE